MSSNIARLLGAAAIAGAPMLGLMTPAHAAAGCSVDNASTSFVLQVHVEVPPPAATYDFTNESCSYVTNGGSINASCNLKAGRCLVYDNGTEIWRCTAANSICSNTLHAAPGDVIKLVVDGGSGSVTDAA